MKTRIVYSRWDAHIRSLAIQVESMDGRELTMVWVRQETDMDTHLPKPATIHWASIAAVSPDTALAMAAALERAAQVAREIEGIEAWQRITPPASGMVWRGPGRPEVFIEDGRAWVDIESWEAEVQDAAQ